VRQAGSDDPGKIEKAVRLTEGFAEEIEADLQRYYGIDIVDLARDGSVLTWRKLLVLVDQLPPESAVKTAIRNSVPEDALAELAGDASRAPWSATESLLASLIDEVRMLAWMYASSHSDKAVPKPDPVKRPGVGVKKRRLIPLAAAMALDPRLRGLEPEEAQAKLDQLTGRGHG
jgi:hypothetical protein